MIHQKCVNRFAALFQVRLVKCQVKCETPCTSSLTGDHTLLGVSGTFSGKKCLAEFMVFL